MITRLVVLVALGAGCSDYMLKHAGDHEPGEGSPGSGDDGGGSPTEPTDPIEPDDDTDTDDTDTDDTDPRTDDTDAPLETGEIEEAPRYPDIATDPALEVEAFCDAAFRELRVYNLGDETLHVTGVSISGAGWTLGAVDVPFLLEPGSSTALPLTTLGGAALLVIESDDPDEPVVSLPLHAPVNLAPTVDVSDPIDGAVLLEGADLALAGLVADDSDAPETLGVSWSASLDGVLSTTSAGADGRTGVTWSAAARTLGDQQVTLTATDSCGLSTRATVSFCQDAAVTYDAMGLSGWHFEGMAGWNSTADYLELTDTGIDEVGTAFETSAPVDAGTVSLEFEFYIGGGTGADGISVTALDTTRMTTFLGGTGCGIGFGGGAACTAGPALPGWSIEVDTWYNRGYDPTTEDHLAFTVNGDVDDPEVWVVLPEMEDTGWHHMRVDVLAPHATVTIDGVTYIDQDMTGLGLFPAYVGFTGGTGTYTNWHQIGDLEVTRQVCEGG